MPLKVVSYTQEGCMACMEQSPINREVEKNQNITIEEIDALKNPSSIKEYQLKVTPTTLVIRDGIVKERFEGVVHREQLEEAIRKHL
jgi:thioredoxin 1